MAIDLFLIRYGAWLMPALVLAACVAAIAMVAVERAWRIHRGMRLFTSRLAGTRRGVHGASLGDRVVAHGRIAFSAGVDVAGSEYALVGARLDDREVCLRGSSLELFGVPRGIALVGDVSIVAADERRDVDDVPVALAERLNGAGLGMHASDPVRLSYVRAGETVLVLGRARGIVAGDPTTYRRAARAIGIGPDDDGRIHLVGLGRARDHVWRVARIGVPLATLAVASVLFLAPWLSFHAPRTPWTLPQPDGQLPLAYWLPLASPMRSETLVAAGSWTLAHRARRPDDQHAIELLFAVGDHTPLNCRIEAEVAAFRRPPSLRREARMCDTVIARASRLRLFVAGDRADVDDVRVLVAALDRDAQIAPADAFARSAMHFALRCDECGLLSESFGTDPWLVTEVLLTTTLLRDRMRQLRGEWLRELAIWQATLRVPGVGPWTLLAASEREPHDEADVDRARRAIVLLAAAHAAEHDEDPAPLSDLEVRQSIRSAYTSLPTASELRAHLGLVASGAEISARSPRAAATALAHLAVVLDHAGATEGARDLARLAVRVAARAEHAGPPTDSVLAALPSRP